MPYGFQSRYLPIIMRQHGVSITLLGLFKLLLIPWIMKFFIASFLIDKYRTKKFWLLLTLFVLSSVSFLTSLLCGFFNFNNDTLFVVVAISLFVLNIASATQDILTDWLAMHILTPEDLGLGNTIQVGGFKLGSLFSGGIMVYLIDYVSLERGFMLFSIIYLISFVLLRVLFNFVFLKNKKDETNKTKKEDEENSAHSFKELFKMLHESPGTYWICLFVLVYKLGEQSSLNLLPIYFLDHKIDSSRIGLWTGIYGQTASILGSFLAGVFLKKTSNK